MGIVPTANLEYDAMDLLDRQSFVDQLMNVAQTLSENKKSACYAINGEWGVGKTFVLDMFEKAIYDIGQDGTVLSRYLVFHYNCWQYDYYEEPLIAIVAAMLDSIDEQVCLLSEKNREGIKEVLKLVGMNVLTKVNEKIEEKTGVDVKHIYELLDEIRQGTEKNYTEKHEFDPYFEFKKTIKSLSETIRTLSKEQTVVFVVDELDRCMPEYAIKVLERLHHIFFNVENTQVVLAVDKRQLENTVEQIYGKKVGVKQYLAKFIDFELNLPVGEVSKEIKVIYAPYFNSFLYDVSNMETVEGVCSTILNGIQMRTLKAIVEKSYLCHRLLTVEATDASVFCIELFLSILRTYDLNIVQAKRDFNIESLFSGSNIFEATDQVLTGLSIMGTKLRSENGENRYYHSTLRTNYRRTTISTEDLWGLLLGCYRIILGYTNDMWINNKYRNIHIGSMDIPEYVRKYWKFTKTIN